MKEYSVYILWSTRLNKRYVGCTDDLETRINEHNKGKQRSTKGGMPWQLIYPEEYQTLIEARQREIYLKGRSGRRFLDNLFME